MYKHFFSVKSDCVGYCLVHQLVNIRNIECLKNLLGIFIFISNVSSYLKHIYVRV